MNTEEIIALFYENGAEILRELDLCRGEKDFRKVYIVDDKTKKLVIKHTSNSFSNGDCIRGWAELAEKYNSLGIYCPATVRNKNGELYSEYTDNGRKYYVYAEEFAKFPTAESLGKEKTYDENGRPYFLSNMMRHLGKVASAQLDVMDHPSAYALLVPFDIEDETDEATECAEKFYRFVCKELPEHQAEAKRLLDMFYSNKRELEAVYKNLPTSCFQADLNDTNILVDEDMDFAGLIDFNISGKEPCINYLCREALWNVSDNRLYDKDDHHELYFYDEALDNRRLDLFFDNIGLIAENYCFTEKEREIFPVLFRYMNSFWWFHVSEIERIKNDSEKIPQLFKWLEKQMTRNDLRLP